MELNILYRRQLCQTDKVFVSMMKQIRSFLQMHLLAWSQWVVLIQKKEQLLLVVNKLLQRCKKIMHLQLQQLANHCLQIHKYKIKQIAMRCVCVAHHLKKLICKVKHLLVFSHHYLPHQLLNKLVR